MGSKEILTATSNDIQTPWVERSLPYRHALPVRVTHWINVVVLTIMLGSGLQIFNAHSTLYWGSVSDPDRAWLSTMAGRAQDGTLKGYTELFGMRFDTTGVLGVSGMIPRGFPEWATIPGPRWLAMGRRWHFFFAWLFVLNGLTYVVYTIGSRHLSHDLLPSRDELKGFGKSVHQHLSVRRLRRESFRGYNVLQKLSYLGVIGILSPLVILTGLTMSPWLNSTFPGLLDLFGGRQSARSLHFLAAFLLVTFFIVHITMVLLVGPINHIRAMITGRLRPPKERTS